MTTPLLSLTLSWLMANITLKATKRDLKGKAKDARTDGQIPGVVYGHETENMAVQCTEQEFHKVYVQAGESTVVELDLDGKKTQVLIHSIQLDPVTSRYEHIDFFVPDMTKEVTTNIPIRTTGEAPGVKDHGGILVRNRDQISVKCLPKDLPHEVMIDLAPLVELHDSVKVGDLNLPGEVNIMEDPETLIISVIPPRKEEEEVKPVAAEGEAAEGEEGAKEGEEKKEGGEEEKGKEEAKKS